MLVPCVYCIYYLFQLEDRVRPSVRARARACALLQCSLSSQRKASQMPYIKAAQAGEAVAAARPSREPLMTLTSWW